ncbi:Fe(3+) dicitrate ABC transporter ATP-binding protein FecE [Rodentibacter pneumotropicus]|uniref:Fe(3+) dicitrate ABC transporter ATP-binding protein FecE n=1 Tax=Rodentibacter pneumotropicus TaxID=758 RepID=UPI0009866A38|nr:ferric citrate ABC transporter ATP-binding protein FecE [Rodentibacter pneumotropicus]
MMLAVTDLQLAYQETIIIPNLNITFPQNQITALLGPNGCGKSTLLKALARLLKPKSGKIHYQAVDIWQKSAKTYAKTLSFLPQKQIIPEGISVRELVSFGRSPYLNLWGRLSPQDESLVEQALAATQMTAFADYPATSLSGGQQQRAFLAMVLAQNTEIVLLDEPTTYLDLSHQAELMTMMRTLQKQGKTVITVLHDLNQACRYCDHLVVLKQGELVKQGTPKQVMSERLLKQVFDLDVEIHADPVSQTPMFVFKS